MDFQIEESKINNVNCLIKFGETAELILDTIASEDYDVLFIGHGGKGRFKGLLGSVARKVITASHKPVMVIKKEFVNNKIAGLIDETEVSNSLIELTLDFYRISQAKDIEFVSMSGDKSLEPKIREILDKITISGENPVVKIKIPLAYNMVYELSSFLTEDSVDVAVLKRSRKDKPRRLFLGSTTARLLDLFPGNLFICPD